jgi:hypothetical protein
MFLPVQFFSKIDISYAFKYLAEYNKDAVCFLRVELFYKLILKCHLAFVETKEWDGTKCTHSKSVPYNPAQMWVTHGPKQPNLKPSKHSGTYTQQMLKHSRNLQFAHTACLWYQSVLRPIESSNNLKKLILVKKKHFIFFEIGNKLLNII